MSAYSYSDLVSLAQQAGFSGINAYIAAAIALAESGGQSSIIGDQHLTPGGSVGLWQINLKAHPEYSGSDLMNPSANAAAAYQVFQGAGNSFTPWTTFKNGSYLDFLNLSGNDSQPADLSAIPGDLQAPTGPNVGMLVVAGLVTAGVLLWVWD